MLGIQTTKGFPTVLVLRSGSHGPVAQQSRMADNWSHTILSLFVSVKKGLLPISRFLHYIRFVSLDGLRT